jgi:hypothetical protein
VRAAIRKGGDESGDIVCFSSLARE